MKLFTLVCLFVSFVFVSPVCAQSPAENEPLQLNEIVVTASRDTQEVRQAPANVSVITAADIQTSGAATIVELLEKLESIRFHSYSGNAAQSMIDVRGFGGDNPFGKTLILLNGRRLNRTDMASVSWLSLPLDNIERIEIVRGPGSVLYGDAAIGGVINVITRKGSGKPAFNIS
ncbi:MAG TPA: TonB-dependent receptor plug domain-containing protein, partial [Smithellaceae bacterium]|nr:TonB-dependent receptor plug domain-containing protein [Smithellaceae bacterium]